MANRRATQSEERVRSTQVDHTKYLLQGLRHWHKPDLTTSGILTVPAIQSLCAVNGNRDVEGTIRQILIEAIDKLRPSDAVEHGAPAEISDPRWRDEDWIKYLILYAPFIDPRYRDKKLPFWEELLNRSQATFYRRQSEALQTLERVLNQIAQAALPSTRLGDAGLAACWVQSAPPMLPTIVVPRDALMGTLRQAISTVQQQALIHGKTIALFGAAGMGKTTVLTALAHDEVVRAQFPDGVLWAVAGEANQNGGVSSNVYAQMLTWAGALGVAQTTLSNCKSISQVKQQMFEAIGTRRILMMVDDVWSQADIDALMVAASRSVLLFTTRSMELAHQISPCHAIAIGEFTYAESLRMITQFAPNAVEFEPTRVDALLNRLAGWPHALQIAAYQLGIASRSAQRRRIRERLDALLDAEGWDILQAIIETIVNEMSHGAQEMLFALSLFSPKPASFTETAAVETTHATLEAFDGVMDSGLMQMHTSIESHPGEDRYTIHQSVLDYARLRLLQKPSVEVRRVQAQFAEYFSQYAHVYAADHGALLAEHEHILRAAALAVEHRFDAALIKIALAITPFLKSRGQRIDAIALLQQAYPAAERCKDIQSCAQLANELAQCYFLLDDISNTEHWSDAVDQIARDNANDAVVLRCLSMVLDLRVRIAQQNDDSVTAEKFSHRAMVVSQRASVQHVLDRQLLVLKEIKITDLGLDPTVNDAQSSPALMQVESLKWLQQAGQNYIMSTNLPVAHECLLKALTYANSSGEPAFIGNTLGFLTLICCTIGEYEQAVTASTDALRMELTETFPRNYGLASGFGALAWLHLGELDKAAHLIQHGRIMADRLQSHETSSWVSFAASCHSLACNDARRANELAHIALLAAERGHAQDSIATMYGMCGRAHTALGQFDLAEQNLRAAQKEAYNELQREYALADLGLLAEKRGRYDEAVSVLQASYAFHVQKQVRRYVPVIGIAYSRALLQLNQRAQALEIANQSLTLAQAIHDVRQFELQEYIARLLETTG